MPFIKGLIATAFVISTASGALAAPSGTKGNDLPKVPMKGSYTLQVISFGEICPDADGEGSSRHTIFVNDDNNNKILLTEGDFKVLDGNACNDGPAEFQLPKPEFDTLDPDLVDVSEGSYEVYVRLVGKPGGRIDVETCGTADEDIGDAIDSGDYLCSLDANLDLTRVVGKGNKPKFMNATRELLTLCLDTDGDLVCDLRVGLFDDRLTDYLWEWDTEGRAHAQLIFVPVP